MYQRLLADICSIYARLRPVLYFKMNRAPDSPELVSLQIRLFILILYARFHPADFYYDNSTILRLSQECYCHTQRLEKRTV